MKKIYAVVQAHDRESALARLRTLGVVHVEHQRLPQGENVGHLEEEISRSKLRWMFFRTSMTTHGLINSNKNLCRTGSLTRLSGRS